MLSRIPIKDFKKKYDIVSAFIEHDGEILLLLRQDHKPQGNTWAMPAGKVNVGEDMLDALVREIEEEIGVKTKREDYKFHESYYIRYPEYDNMYHVYHLLVKEKPEIILGLDEHKDYKWITPAESLRLNLIQDEDMSIKYFYNID
jgi:8-oxo-dGTP pyrophosphatase MutT (NUDIX family)